MLPEGNLAAQQAMDRVFEIADAEWRGLGTVPASGLRIREAYARFDATHAFPAEVAPAREPPGCPRCVPPPGPAVAEGGVPDRGGLYQTPWALSERCFLASYSHARPLSGTQGGDNATGFAIYLIDVHGTMDGSPGATLNLGGGTLSVHADVDLSNYGSVNILPSGRLEGRGHTDYIIDLGPEGGIDGGHIAAQGNPWETIQQTSQSYTARFLSDYVSQ